MQRQRSGVRGGLSLRLEVGGAGGGHRLALIIAADQGAESSELTAVINCARWDEAVRE